MQRKEGPLMENRKVDFVQIPDSREADFALLENREVHLAQVLEFRENKAAIQKEMGMDMSKGVVVSLGMNIPGPVKSGTLLSEAFHEGKVRTEELIARQGGRIAQKAVLEEQAGYAAIYLVKGIDRHTLKKEAVRLEETHPLGRLFDLDVLGEDGCPVTREEAGAERRTCLLCGRDAKVCGRNRTHSVEELQRKVREILVQWKAGQK